MFRGTEELGIGEDLPGLCKLMPQLRAIGWKVMESSNDEETGQAAVGQRSIHRSSGSVMCPLRSGIVHEIHCCADSASWRNGYHVPWPRIMKQLTSPSFRLRADCTNGSELFWLLLEGGQSNGSGVVGWTKNVDGWMRRNGSVPCASQSSKQRSVSHFRCEAVSSKNHRFTGCFKRESRKPATLLATSSLPRGVVWSWSWNNSLFPWSWGRRSRTSAFFSRATPKMTWRHFSYACKMPSWLNPTYP